MAKTNTRKYIIYGSIATIVGVIGYYIWKSSKKDEKPKDETPAPDNDGKEKDGKVNETPVKDNKGKDGGGGDNPEKDKALASPTGFDKATGDKFRVWFNDNYPEMAGKKGFDLDRSGEPDNSNIRRAYYKYSAEWKKYVASPVTTPTSNEVLLASNQNGVATLAKAWGMTTSYAQLSGAPTGTLALQTVRDFVGANSRGVNRYYRMYLYAQESAKVKKSIWRIKEYYKSTWGYEGDLIGQWDGYFEVSNGTISFTVKGSGTKTATTNANDFIKKATGVTSQGWFGS
jgi:hypothetical protein